MGINDATNRFLDSLTQLVNESKLPPANVRLCLDIARLQVVRLEKQAIARERAQEKKAQEAAKAKQENGADE
ncbi:MAG: hypothetical protein LUC39_01755 [Clostridiales bacterium]|nr:hypothetical protein [Clostridiales bacterium]